MGLQSAASGHICKLCTYYKQYTLIWAVSYTTFNVILPTAAREPAHKNGCGTWP